MIAFVLGAGASAHVGYPLSGKFNDAIYRSSRDDNCDGQAVRAAAGRIFADDKAIFDDFSNRFGQVKENISIDEFLELNPDLRDFGILAIADALLRTKEKSSFEEDWYTPFLKWVRRPPGENPRSFDAFCEFISQKLIFFTFN